MNTTFNTIIFYPMSYSEVNVYLQSSSIIIATGYFLSKSFSIQADYTSLSAYKYLLCDVSASTIISTNINIPTKDINLTPLSNYNYISDLYDTQVNQFYIINQLINYDLITSITFNVSSLTIFSNTQYASITLYSNTSITLYSVSSITFYSSSTSYTSITLYNYTSSTIYSYSSIISYTSTTVYAYSSSTIYSSTTVYSSTELQPIILSYTGNITSWSTTYSLTYYQTMIITFEGSQVLFIPLQLTGNDNYDFIISQDITAYNYGGTGVQVDLYPNNANVSVVYTEFYVAYGGGPINDIDTARNIYPAIRITDALGSVYGTIINNSPFTKTVICNNVQLGTNFDPAARLPAQIWNDYKTSWTIFGTIRLPQPSSGYIKITRIG